MADAKKKRTDLGGPEGGITLKGSISEVRESDMDDFISVTVRHGPKPKKGKDGFPTGKWPKTTNLDIPLKAGKGLAVDDDVQIKVLVNPGKGASQAVRV